jgi:hypothetical protein
MVPGFFIMPGVNITGSRVAGQPTPWFYTNLRRSFKKTKSHLYFSDAQIVACSFLLKPKEEENQQPALFGLFSW